MLDNILKQMDTLYEQMQSCASTSGRKANGQKMFNMFFDHPQIQKYWQYNPNEFYWVNRFVKIATYNFIKPKEIPIFYDEDTNLRNAPHTSGLYFFGVVNSNPFTHKEFYNVKIGLASDIAKRLNSYRTHSPMVKLIALYECEDYREQEKKYHTLLNQHATFRNQNNDEWWFVDRDTYLQMSEKGFSYFD